MVILDTNIIIDRLHQTGSKDSVLSNFLKESSGAIAATAIVNDAKLFTLNKKDFQNIKDLELI